ncbi:MAG: response regulator [Patescibacteria group bacterium]
MPERTASQSGHSILIIDDDAFLLDMYAVKFTQRGFQVSTSSGTLLALEKLRNGESADVILVDLVMPAMDGFAFLEQLRKEKLVPDAIIIVLSNLGQKEDIDRSLRLGAASHIIKASATPSEVVEQVLKEIKNKK